MKHLHVRFEKLTPDAIFPTRGHDGDAGLDLYASEDKTLFPIHSIPHPTKEARFVFLGEWTKEHKKMLMVSTSIAMEIPDGYYGKIEDRSSMGCRGIRTLGGIIDSNYRGEVKVLLANLTGAPYVINKGDRIAQIIIQPYLSVIIDTVEEVGGLKITARGDGGFGSTGK